MNQIDALKLFQDDPQIEAIVLIGEIGGTAEEAAAYIQRHVTKQLLVILLVWLHLLVKHMGHAGAIISGGQGTAEEKFKAFEDAGIAHTRDPSKIGDKLKEVTGW